MEVKTQNTYGPPCTQNGFTGSRNGEVIPEWRFADRQKPEQGAKLFEVVDGREKLVGVFDGKKWISVK